MSYSSSSAITSSTMSSESAPRSSMKDASGVTSLSLTPSCSQMISRTFCSTAEAITTSYPYSLDVQAAVDADHLAGDVPRLAAGQKANQLRHFLHRAQPTHRNELEILRSPVLGQVGGHLGLDQPRRHGVDRDLAR